MKKRIVRYLKHILSTIIVLGGFAVVFGLYHGAALHYGDSPLIYKMNNEGPYVFYKNDSILNVNFVKGNKMPLQVGMCFSNEPMIAINPIIKIKFPIFYF